MGWLLFVLSLAVIAALAFKVVQQNRALASAKAPKPAKRFGLADLRALSEVVTDKGRGTTLAAVLAHLRLENGITSDYAGFTAQAATDQEMLAESVKRGDAEILRIKERNRQLQQQSIDLKAEVAEVGALVGNAA